MRATGPTDYGECATLVARKRLREALCSFGADTRQFKAMNDFCAEDGAPPVDWGALAGK